MKSNTSIQLQNQIALLNRENLTYYVYEFWLFGLKQASACVFGAFMLSMMIITSIYYPLEFLHRYDFLSDLPKLPSLCCPKLLERLF